MQASQLDYDMECPACGGTGDALEADRRSACPICEGTGTFNRNTSMPSGEVLIGEVNYYQQGPVIKVERLGRMPIQDDVTGGFEGRFGSFQPSNPDPNYEPDTADQFNNSPLGTNGPYDVYGYTVDSSNMPGGSWPSGADLTVNQAIAWKRARGDEITAQRLETIKSEAGL